MKQGRIPNIKPEEDERAELARSSARRVPVRASEENDAPEPGRRDRDAIEAMRAILASYDHGRLAVSVATTDNAVGPAVSDKGIGADGGASLGEAPMTKVYLCKDRGSTWRVRLVDVELKKKKNYVFATEEEARAAIPRIQSEYRRPVGVLMSKALDAYRVHLETRGNRRGHPNLPRTVEVTQQRLRKVFSSEIYTGELTAGVVEKLWDVFKVDKAVDTQLGVLAQSKTFLRWMNKKGWLKHPDALDGIEVLGKRKKGKPQLTEDESKRLLEYAIRLGRAGDEGAIATATALLLGLRAREIVERIVRDFDAGGTKLWITTSKTAAGVRTMRVPAVLQELLKILASGKQSSDYLFKVQDRHWVLRSVRRLCREASVPSVCAHGLRGTHARLAVEAGISGDVVARSLGHENFGVTTEHYAGAGAVADAAAARVADALK